MNNWVFLNDNPWHCDYRICGLRSWLLEHPQIVRGPIFDTLSEEFHGLFVYLYLDTVTCSSGHDESKYKDKSIEYLPVEICNKTSKSTNPTLDPTQSQPNDILQELWLFFVMGGIILLLALLLCISVFIIRKKRLQKPQPEPENNNEAPPDYHRCITSLDNASGIFMVDLPPKKDASDSIFLDERYDKIKTGNVSPYLRPKETTDTGYMEI